MTDKKCICSMGKQTLHTYVLTSLTSNVLLLSEGPLLEVPLYSGLPLIQPPLGPIKVSLIRGMASFQGQNLLTLPILGLFEVA